MIPVSPSLKDLLQNGKPLIGTLLTVASPEVAEALSLVGFDWIFIDLEHGSLSIQDAQRAVQAVANRSFTLIRVPDGTPEHINRALDTGCSGIIVPFVNTESYARRVVSLAKYPPLGERSAGLGRAQGFGMNFAGYLQSANLQTTVVVQIEHREAVANIDQILAVPGIDAAFIGPYDLSGSLGLLGQVSHPEVSGAVDSVRTACARSNSAYGIFCSTAEQAGNAINGGATLVAVGTDILHMAHSAGAALEMLRKAEAPNHCR
jgi:2-keto-3-deoxy-L-rhamnonate aldolase RhmA